jgi:FkbM family methyltransferase
MNQDELAKYAQENAERFWKDAGEHWLNDRLDLKADAHVVEVGGYLGNWADYVARKYECYVEVYEPVKEFYDHMLKRFSNRPNIQVKNVAVLDGIGEAHIAVMGEGSTFYTPGACEGPNVAITDIDKIVRPVCGLVDLLALNCEGSEYDILDRLLFTGNIWRVDRLLVQFHANHLNAETRRSAIREKLTKTHSEVWAYPYCWELWKIHGEGV